MTEAEKIELALSSKDMFFQVGLATYLAQCFEKGVLGVVLGLNTIEKKGVWSSQDFYSYLDKLNGHTLGTLLRNLRGVITIAPEDDAIFKQALESRNLLAHNYFGNHFGLMVHVDGHKKIISDMLDMQKVLRRADDLAQTWTFQLMDQLGWTKEMLNSHMHSIVDSQLKEFKII